MTQEHNPRITQLIMDLQCAAFSYWLTDTQLGLDEPDFSGGVLVDVREYRCYQKLAGPGTTIVQFLLDFFPGKIGNTFAVWSTPTTTYFIFTTPE